MKAFHHFIRSPSSYPLTAVYTAGVALAVCVSQYWVALGTGLVVFTLITMVAIFYALMHEIRGVRRQLALSVKASSQQTVEFTVRIDELIAALADAGVDIPHPEEPGP